MRPRPLAKAIFWGAVRLAAFPLAMVMVVLVVAWIKTPKVFVQPCYETWCQNTPVPGEDANPEFTS